MGIVSIRFNQVEERIINELVEYFNENRSKLMKRVLFEMYENLIDRREIEIFEKKENKSGVKFYKKDELFSELKDVKKSSK